MQYLCVGWRKTPVNPLVANLAKSGFKSLVISYLLRRINMMIIHAPKKIIIIMAMIQPKLSGLPETPSFAINGNPKILANIVLSKKNRFSILRSHLVIEIN